MKTAEAQAMIQELIDMLAAEQDGEDDDPEAWWQGQQARDVADGIVDGLRHDGYDAASMAAAEIARRNFRLA